MKQNETAVGPLSTQSELRAKAAEMAVKSRDFKPLATDFCSSYQIPMAEAEGFISDVMEIVDHTAKLGDKYFTLCKRVRRLQLTPKATSAMLSALGFRKQRIAEVNKVCQASDEVFSSYEAKALSFKGVLQIERGEAVVDQLGLTDKEKREALNVEEVEPGAERKKGVSATVKLALAMKSAAVAAGKLSGKALKNMRENGVLVNPGNGFVCEVRVAKEGEKANVPGF